MLDVSIGIGSVGGRGSQFRSDAQRMHRMCGGKVNGDAQKVHAAPEGPAHWISVPSSPASHASWHQSMDRASPGNGGESGVKTAVFGALDALTDPGCQSNNDGRVV